MQINGPTFTLIAAGVIIFVLATFIIRRMAGKGMTYHPDKQNPPKDGASSYEWYVRRSILSQDVFNIKEIQQLERIRSLYFNRDTYSLVKEVISKTPSIAFIRDFPLETCKSDEDIEIVTFLDQDGKQFVAAIYDSWDLWQDPEAIDIFPLLQTV